MLCYVSSMSYYANLLSYPAPIEISDHQVLDSSSQNPALLLCEMAVVCAYLGQAAGRPYFEGTLRPRPEAYSEPSWPSWAYPRDPTSLWNNNEWIPFCAFRGICYEQSEPASVMKSLPGVCCTPNLPTNIIPTNIA